MFVKLKVLITEKKVYFSVLKKNKALKGFISQKKTLTVLKDPHQFKGFPARPVIYIGLTKCYK